MSHESVTALVTGGGGFLGSAIVRRLLRRGDRVHVLARSDYPELQDAGARLFRGDVSDLPAVTEAARGCTLVFHVAAKAGVWGRRSDFEHTNIAGTAAVIQACRDLGIEQLVFTSSPSVTFAGRDQEGVDESAPYPDRFLADYPRTKAEAEQLVIAANDRSLATVSLRPHLIWGPGDNHLIPRVIARGKAGQLRVLGNGRNVVDLIYVENAVDAHLAAADVLRPGATVAGKVYFISDGAPVALWEFINRVLSIAGVPEVRRKVPAGVAYAAGRVLEDLFRLTGQTEEPRMTRFVARQLATSHWFDIGASRRDFGYEPRVRLDEGLEHLEAWLRKTRQIG